MGFNVVNVKNVVNVSAKHIDHIFHIDHINHILFIVVGFVSEDGHGAVELFQAKQPNHLMAKSELGQGK